MDLATIIILAGLLGVVGPLLFWGGLVWAGVKAARKLQDSSKLLGSAPLTGGGAGIGLDPQFLALMQELQQLVRAAQGGGHHGGITQGILPPELQLQFNANMARAQRDLCAMDDLHRQQADLRMADMMSQASSAGIDVSSWRFNG